MLSTGSFVFISLSENDYNGKKYYKASVEDKDTGKILVFDTDVLCVPKLAKYTEYNGYFDVSQYGKDTRMRLLDVDLVKK